MSIIRIAKKKNPFVMIDKTCLEDPRLSWKAKGLLSYLLSRPDDWDVKVSHLVKQSTDGRDAVYAAINELREFGYCYRSAKQLQDDSGKLIGYEYTIYEIPEPCTGFPYKDKPDREKPTHNNIDSNKKEFNNSLEEEGTIGPWNIFGLYTENIGPIMPMLVDELIDAEKHFEFTWIEDAFKIAVKRNARNWAYIYTILVRWETEGRDAPKPSKNGKGATSELDDALAEWAKEKELEYADQ